MLIEKTVELTQKDIFGLRMVYLKDTRLLHLFVVVFLFGITNLILNFIGKTDTTLYLLSLLLVLLLPAYLLLSYYMAKVIKKETVVFNHPMTFTMNEEELQVNGYRTATAIDWSDFVAYMEDKNAFYFLISSLQAYLLPKRYLDKDELDNVHFILSNHLKKRKNKVLRIISTIACFIFVLAITANVFSICQNISIA